MSALRGDPHSPQSRNLWVPFFCPRIPRISPNSTNPGTRKRSARKQQAHRVSLVYGLIHAYTFKYFS